MSASSDPTPPTARQLERARVRAELRQKLFGADGAAIVIERFRVMRRLGAGATGVVYAAHDPTLDRDVAIKVLLDGGGDRAAMLAEARAMARLAHPNLLPVFEVSDGGGAAPAYLVTELVERGTLRRWLETPHPLAARQALIAGVAAGVAEAHRHGLTHRDLKPENILVGADDRPRVADFGLAVSFRGANDRGGPGPGTPTYMAPEVADGRPADPRSDQFALALIAREVLAGVPPTAPRDAALADVPAHLAAAITRGLATDPAARWPGVDAFAAALAAPPRRRARLLVAVVVLALLGLAVALVLARRDRAAPPTDPAIALFQRVNPLLQAGRYRECAVMLDGAAQTDPMRAVRVQCALATEDPALIDAACAAWRAEAPATVSPACASHVDRARALERAGDARGCAELLLASPPSTDGFLVLTRCSAVLRDQPTYRRQCLYQAELAPDPAAARTRCASIPL